MAVHRLRPVDGEDEPHSDDLGNDVDEELEVSHEQLIEALGTRIGGRDPKNGADHNDSTEDAGHRANSAAGIKDAQTIWKVAAANGEASVAGLENTLPSDELGKVLKAARASQSRETTFKNALADAQERGGGVEAVNDATRARILAWREEARTRVNKDNRRVLNDGQFSMVSQVVDRVLAEAKELGDKGRITSEPLRWLLHGGPRHGEVARG